MSVMIAIFVLAMLAGAFAFSMKVEMHLAMNANNEANLIWLGRSGVELAKYVVSQQMLVPSEPYDALNQKWAGGPGTMAESNSPLSEISLKDYQVGDGKVSVSITDCERKLNINVADSTLLQKVLGQMQMDASDIPTVSDSILDWISTGNTPRLNGAKNDYYQSLDPPYYAKNAPMDDPSEMLLVKGVTPDLYWGSSSTNYSLAYFQKPPGPSLTPDQQNNSNLGLADIFTAISSGKININTASADVLAMLPGIDQINAECIVKQRAGPDGTDGTEDDLPFRNVGELINCVPRGAMPYLQRICDVRSRTFEVKVEASIGPATRTFYAIIARNSPNDVQILSFYWK